jgi:hypothetical protein
MRSKRTTAAMSFKQAVKATPDICTCYKSGLSALRDYSKRVSVTDTTKLQGSVDIDACTTSKYPQDNRWDYALAYKGEVFFVEVHSAMTSEVKTVLKKLQWLKDWLHSQAPEINKLKAQSSHFLWIQSNNFQIPKTAPQYLMAVQAGLKPIKKLELK